MGNLIYKKMSEVMREVGAIGKSQTNTQQGFKFRGIDNFVNALYPALTKHGVFMAPECTSYTQELKEVVRSSGKAGIDKHVSMQIKYHFYAEDGSFVTIGPIPAEGLDSGDKATNKALSAALKYALIQTFSIPTEDMVDGDSTSPVIEKSLTSSSTAKVMTTNAVTSTTQETTTTPAVTVSTPTVSTGVVASGSTTANAAARPRTTFRSTKPKAASTTTATATKTNGAGDDAWNN